MNAARAQASKTTPANIPVVAAALAAKRPKARYRVGLDSRSSALARRVLPDRVTGRGACGRFQSDAKPGKRCSAMNPAEADDRVDPWRDHSSDA